VLEEVEVLLRGEMMVVAVVWVLAPIGVEVEVVGCRALVEVAAS
jgi:hypothetical protein